MKRSSFKRKRSRNRSRNPFPRKKSKPMRARSPTNSYRKRERFLDYMMAVKSLPCAAVIVPGHVCEGPIEADHAGPRGIGQKAHDGTVIPLCRLAHRQRTDFSGVFRDWNQAKMRDFLFGRIMQTRRYLDANGVVVPRMRVEDAKALTAWKIEKVAPLVKAFMSTEVAKVLVRRLAEDIREEGNIDVRQPDTAPLATEGNHR